MKKGALTKRLIIMGAILCGVVALSVTVFAVRNQDDTSFLWGKLEQEYRNDAVPYGNDTPAIIGEHFTIPSKKLNHVIEVQLLIDSNPDTAEATSKKILIEEYSLYYQAQQADVVVTDEYLDNFIEENIVLCEEALPDNPQYVSFLDGLGMTNEEYWRSRKDNLRMTESIAAWKDLKYNEFLKENGYDTAPPENLPELWETYLNELIAEIIEQEHIRYTDAEAS